MQIKISNNIHDLTGVGAEILVDSDGNVLAEFYNGNFAKAVSPGNSEITKIS